MAGLPLLIKVSITWPIHQYDLLLCQHSATDLPWFHPSTSPDSLTHECMHTHSHKYACTHAFTQTRTHASTHTRWKTRMKRLIKISICILEHLPVWPALPCRVQSGNGCHGSQLMQYEQSSACGIIYFFTKGVKFGFVCWFQTPRGCTLETAVSYEENAEPE